jgi:DDE superfamily endonuclease
MLEPFLIYNGSANAVGRIYQELVRREGYPTDIQFAVQKAAWMDEDMMLKWVDKVWQMATLDKGGCMMYLSLVEYLYHMTSYIAQAFQSCSTEINIVPGGYTSMLEAMELGLNKPFKAQCWHNCDLWIKEHGYTGLPHWKDAAWWVDRACKGLVARMVKKGT